MWVIKSERREPPPEYVDHVTALGGLNRFDEPNFRLAWGQTETDCIYGFAEGIGTGQHIRLTFGGIPAWHLMSWKPPETFGTPQLWDALSWQPETSSHLLGEFPYRGLYLGCNFRLYTQRFIRQPGSDPGDPTEEMVIDAMPLAHWVLELLVPNVIKDQEITLTQKRIAIRNRMAAEEAERRQKTEDAYRNAAPAFGGVAGTYESNRLKQMDRIKRGVSAEEIKDLLGTGHKQQKRIIH